MTDLLLAIAHHLLVFTLFGLLAAELVLLGRDLPPRRLTQLAVVDMAYGTLAGLVLLVGFLRVYYGDKGPDFYWGNHAFWGKLAAFGAVGLLSLGPTLTVLRWRRQGRGLPDYTPPATEIGQMRLYLYGELACFAAIPVFAALMARGMGS